MAKKKAAKVKGKKQRSGQLRFAGSFESSDSSDKTYKYEHNSNPDGNDGLSSNEPSNKIKWQGRPASRNHVRPEVHHLNAMIDDTCICKVGICVCRNKNDLHPPLTQVARENDGLPPKKNYNYSQTCKRCLIIVFRSLVLRSFFAAAYTMAVLTLKDNASALRVMYEENVPANVLFAMYALIFVLVTHAAYWTYSAFMELYGLMCIEYRAPPPYPEPCADRPNKQILASIFILYIVPSAFYVCLSWQPTITAINEHITLNHPSCAFKFLAEQPWWMNADQNTLIIWAAVAEMIVVRHRLNLDLKRELSLHAFVVGILYLLPKTASFHHKGTEFEITFNLCFGYLLWNLIYQFVWYQLFPAIFERDEDNYPSIDAPSLSSQRKLTPVD